MRTGSDENGVWASFDDEDPRTQAEINAQIARAERETAEHQARDLSPLLGLPVGEAVAAVERMGLEARVFDERSRGGAANFDTGRIDLYVVRGRVRDATAG